MSVENSRKAIAGYCEHGADITPFLTEDAVIKG